MAVKRIKRKGGAKARITAKQKAARRKNIEIARKHRRKAGAKKTKGYKKTSSRVDSKGRKITTYKKKSNPSKATVARRRKKGTDKGRAGQAFKKKYDTLRKANKGQGMSKAWARREGHTAAMKVSKVSGQKMARKYATGVARKKLKMDKKGARQFASGYVNSILRDIVRGG